MQWAEVLKTRRFSGAQAEWWLWAVGSSYKISVLVIRQRLSKIRQFLILKGWNRIRIQF
jgi:hypothetical protein